MQHLPRARKLVMGILSVLGALAIVLGGAVTAQALTVVATITTPGPQPGLAVYSPNGGFAYVLDGNGVHKLDLATNTFVADLPVGTAPFDMVISPNGRYIFVSNEGDSTITIIDATNWIVANTIAFTGSNQPPAGTFTPRTLAISPNGNDLFVSNSTGDYIADLNVSNVSAVTVRNWCNMGWQSWAMTLSPNGASLFVTARGSTDLQKVDTSGLVLDWHVSLPIYVNYLAVSPDGTYLFATDTSLGRVVKYAASNGSTTSPGLFVGVTSPTRIAFSPDSLSFYVTSRTSGQLVTADVATMTATSTLAVGSSPSGVSGNTAGTDFLVMRNTNDAVVRVTNPVSPTPSASLAATGKSQDALNAGLWLGVSVLGAGVMLLAGAGLLVARQRVRSDR